MLWYTLSDTVPKAAGKWCCRKVYFWQRYQSKSNSLPYLPEYYLPCRCLRRSLRGCCPCNCPPKHASSYYDAWHSCCSSFGLCRFFVLIHWLFRHYCGYAIQCRLHVLPTGSFRYSGSFPPIRNFVRRCRQHIVLSVYRCYSSREWCRFFHWYCRLRRPVCCYLTLHSKNLLYSSSLPVTRNLSRKLQKRNSDLPRIWSNCGSFRC